MSTIRDPATITKVGRQMMTAGGDITYTKAVLYGQDISHLTQDQLEGLTSIGNPLMTVPLGISDKSDNGNSTTVILEATFQNSNLKADLPYTAVGFFAKRGDEAEKLVAVGVATDGAYLAATSPDGVATDALDIKVAIAIGDSANVTAMIDPAGSVTPAVLHDTATKIRSEMKSGLYTKANTADVNKSLDLKADKQTVIDDLAKKADQDDVAAKLATKADKADVDTQIGTVTKSVSDLSATVKSNKDDADKALATKADKATVESDLATKASQSDLDKTNSEVAKKADKTDVDAQIGTVNKSVSDLSATVTANKKATDSTLATKANASDVADSLVTKADKTDVASDVKSLNDAINTKASQADLDKTNAVVATKANATALADYARTVDVDADLDTKANKTDLESLAKTADVNSALDTKADKATVNSDIKTINDTMTTKASQSDLDKTNATVATKADKTTVDGDVKTLQASIDTKADKTALDDYAKSADVASDVKTLTDSIATKADAKTVNDAISKIDFTPYAKSADVDSKLKGYTDTTDLTKLLAGKADSDFSYSKAELDKKLLDLTTTTGGKVDANQVATMIENKADKSDVTKQIGTVTDLVNTKANSTDVTAALDKKDDITDVDAKIKTVTDAVNIKANSSDVNNQITSINKALSQLIPDETHASELSAGFDLNSSFVGWRRSVNKSLKNAPFGWVNDMMIFQGTVAGGDGRFELALYIGDTESTNPKVAYRYFGWNKWKPWVLLADNGDISDVRNQISANVDKLNQSINTKANSSDVTALQSKVNVNSSLYRMIGDNDTWLKIFGVNNNDTPVLTSLRLQGGTGPLLGNFAAGVGFGGADTKGVLSVAYADHQARITGGNGDDPVWSEDIAWKSDISNLQSQVTKAQSTADSANGNANGRLGLTGGNMNTGSVVQWNGGGIDDKSGNLGGVTWSGGTDYAKIYGDQDNNDNLDLAFDLGDDGSNHFSFRKNGTETSAITSDGHYTGTVDWGHVNGRPDVATKADVNSTNATIATLSQTVQSLKDTLDSATTTIKSLQSTVTSLQDTVNTQATTITGLQTQVNNQAQDIAYIKANYIEGKRFAKADESQATAWEKENSQRIAFITDN